MQAQQVTYQGPLPAPKVLADYDAVIPGAAERILAMAERQQQHRFVLESSNVNWGIRRSFAGLLVTLSFLGVSGVLIGQGHDTAGTVLGTVDLVALASVFVYGNKTVQDERKLKAQIMAGQRQP